LKRSTMGEAGAREFLKASDTGSNVGVCYSALQLVTRVSG